MRAGAKLSDADKAKLKKMNAELAALQTKFSQNVLKEKNADSVVVDKEEDLAGFSAPELAAARAAAKEEKKEGKFVLPLQNTTEQPPLTSLKNRAAARAHHESLARPQQPRRRVGQSRGRAADGETARGTRRAPRLCEPRRLPARGSDRARCRDG